MVVGGALKFDGRFAVLAVIYTEGSIPIPGNRESWKEVRAMIELTVRLTERLSDLLCVGLGLFGCG
ncbi:MAG TPA: hypothetical protein VIJ50_02385 [Solirubrobacteraceae bacterium]